MAYLIISGRVYFTSVGGANAGLWASVGGANAGLVPPTALDWSRFIGNMASPSSDDLNELFLELDLSLRLSRVSHFR